MQAAVIVLGLAALGGATLAAIRLRGAPWPPMWMALGHGGVAALGVVLLGYAAYSPGIPGMAQAALGIFVLAALGGATLFLGFHMQGKPLPIPIVLAHGVLAAIGYALLLVSYLQLA